MLEHVIYFLVISAVTGLVSAAIRLETRQQIQEESTRFFVTITIGVGLFCVLVGILEWIFIRPPI